MKRFLLLTICLVVSFSFAQLSSSYAPLAANPTLEADLLNQTNAQRQANGVAALQPDEQLALAARQHAHEMAQLNYFSHTSPSAGSRTPSQRAAKAGFPFLMVGENIARMPGNNIAVDVTSGWMNSPGHRENLLLTEFTHVGFGTAQDSRGQTVVVQMFGAQPYRLVSAHLAPSQRSEYVIQLNVSVPQGGNMVFYYGDMSTEPQFLQAGTHSLTFRTPESGLLHLQAAILSPDGNGYILQDGGWLTLESGEYVADEIAPKTYAQIVSATVSRNSVAVNEVNLNFDGAANRQLAVFVNDDFQPHAVVGSGSLKVSVPTYLVAPEIVVGEFTDGNRVKVTMLLTIDSSSGRPVLAVKPVE